MIEELGLKLLTDAPLIGIFFLLWKMMNTTLRDNTKALNSLENAIIALKNQNKR
jgi:hypothetical protein